MVKIILTLLFLVYVTVVESEQFCYADNAFPFYNFSHRTQYEKSANKNPIQHPTGCTPIYVWSYIRHGTRFPSQILALKFKDLNQVKEQILSAHEAREGSLHWRDAQRLHDWKFVEELTQEGVYDQLTLQGGKDMATVAHCFRQWISQLLASKRIDYFLFECSDAKRTQDSAIIFVNELFKINTGREYVSENGKLVRFHKYCANYAKEQKKPELQREVELLKSSSYMNKTLTEISRRLGFENILPYDIVETMYEYCAFDSAWIVKEKSPFCAVFRMEDLKVFEYKEDLNLYWKNGYGNPLTEKVGSILIRDMMMKLREATEFNNQSFSGMFYFGHVQMILPIMVKFGLARDEEPLTHENYEKMKDTRQWRLSSIGNFAANIEAILYKCPRKKSKYQVGIYHNGREMVLPKCQKSPCPWEELKSHFETVFDETQCNTDFCN